MSELYMTTEEARAIREALGYTLEQMSRQMGFRGLYARQNYHQIESGRQNLTYAQAHLLRAMAAGYRPMALVPRLRARMGSKEVALAEALQPFVEAYRKNFDPGVSDLDNEQPVAWHVPLGAYRKALSLTAK